MSEPRRPRSLAFWVRWLHVYVSMIGFVALFLFAVTGLTLNHADYFEGGAETTRDADGTLDPQWLAGADAAIDKLAIVEALRSRHGIHGAVHDFDVSDDEVLVVFKGPGYGADATITRADGSYTLSELRKGWLAVLDDLHKGRDSGGGWSLLIDVAAVLMALTSLTGLWLLLYLKKRRGPALWTAVAGALATLAVFWLTVP